MKPKICPYLGLINDPSSNKDFPYESNTCYRAKKPKSVAMPHQRGFCLSDEHTACPGYINGWSDGFPKSLRAYTPTYERVLRSKWVWSALAAVLLVSAYFIFPQQNTAIGNNSGMTEVSQFTEPQSASTIQSTSILTIPTQTTNIQTIPSSTSASVIAENTKASPTTGNTGSNTASDNTGSSEITNNTSTTAITDTSTQSLTTADIETTNQTTQERPYMVEVITNALNIRSEPVYKANGSNIVGTLAKGEIIEVYEEQKGWLRIEKGWIFKFFTKIVD